jgi:divalent metal cation (Fe/Co/Zn/Cd) transporter
MRRVLARLAAASAAATALLLVTAGAVLAQASTSSTVPASEPGARRVNLPFVLIAVAGAALIVLMQRRVSRKLGDMFPHDQEGDEGRGERSKG